MIIQRTREASQGWGTLGRYIMIAAAVSAAVIACNGLEDESTPSDNALAAQVNSPSTPPDTTTRGKKYCGECTGSNGTAPCVLQDVTYTWTFYLPCFSNQLCPLPNGGTDAHITEIKKVTDVIAVCDPKTQTCSTYYAWYNRNGEARCVSK